jgi:hypothetical protein
LIYLRPRTHSLFWFTSVEAEGALNLVIAILQGNDEAVKTFSKALVAEDADRFNIKQKM